ncbi:MAG: hypothetical protein ACYC2G_03425 [Gemmatimonadaceae bacterium]
MGGLKVQHRRARGASVRAAVTLAAVAMAVGCGGRDSASVNYDGPYADEVRALLPKVEEVTGLPFLTPPKLEVRTPQQVREFLEERFREARVSRDQEGQIAAYKRFGLVPDTMDVQKLLLELLTEQIVGFYDPKTKVLYLVEGAPQAERETIIGHELIHALQDQYVNLDSLQNSIVDNDEASALQALLEGQAVYEQLETLLGRGDMAVRLPGGWQRIRQSVRENSTNMPLFSAAPLVIQETLIFPYLSGAEFVRRLKLRDSTPILKSPFPLSTEQVLHAEAYDAPADMPTRIELPAPRDGRVIYQNDLGEFETRLLLFQWSRDQNAAVRAAAGWDGDRYVLFETPQGAAVAWLTVWDTPVDAVEFFDVTDAALARRFRDLRAERVSAQERRYTGGGRAMRLTATEVKGRPAVLFVDVPRGERSDDVLDLSRARLSEGTAAPVAVAPGSVAPGGASPAGPAR